MKLKKDYIYKCNSESVGDFYGVFTGYDKAMDYSFTYIHSDMNWNLYIFTWTPTTGTITEIGHKDEHPELFI